MNTIRNLIKDWIYQKKIIQTHTKFWFFSVKWHHNVFMKNFHQKLHYCRLCSLRTHAECCRSNVVVCHREIVTKTLTKRSESSDEETKWSTVKKLQKMYCIYRVIQNDFRGLNNLPYTIHLRQQYILAPMDQEILRVFFYDVRCAVVMHFSAWSAVY